MKPRRLANILCCTITLAAFASSSASADDKWKQYSETAHKISDPVSKVYLQALATAFLTVDNLKRLENGPENGDQLDSLILVLMTASKAMRSFDVKVGSADFRNALVAIEKPYIDGLGYMLALKKGQGKGKTRKLTETSWYGELAEAKRSLDNSWSKMLEGHTLQLSSDDAQLITKLLSSAE